MLPFQPPTRLMLRVRAVESPKPAWIWCVNVHFKSVSDYVHSPLDINALQLCNPDAFVWRARLVDLVSSMVGLRQR
jgi:hypothetical protein